jgi:hypothetical protein
MDPHIRRPVYGSSRACPDGWYHGPDIPTRRAGHPRRPEMIVIIPDFTRRERVSGCENAVRAATPVGDRRRQGWHRQVGHRANLAVISAARPPVVLIDADLGGANLHTILGVSSRGPTLPTSSTGAASAWRHHGANQHRGLSPISGSAHWSTRPTRTTRRPACCVTSRFCRRTTSSPTWRRLELQRARLFLAASTAWWWVPRPPRSRTRTTS